MFGDEHFMMYLCHVVTFPLMGKNGDEMELTSWEPR